MKRIIALVMALVMLFALVACGAEKAEEPAAAEQPAAEAKTEKAAEEPAPVGPETAGYQPNEELLAKEATTLYVFGPGLFDAGPDGVTDLVTGIARPGFNELIARWNELYPNCELVIEDCPWDGWKAAQSTAALDGKADVIMHGHSIEMHEDLRPYLEADEEMQAAIFEDSNLTCITSLDFDSAEIRGIDAIIAPVVVYIDKEKFEHFGVDLPSRDWKLADLLEISAKLTGTDPVTGEECYGILPFAMGGGNIRYNYSIFGDMQDIDIFTYGATTEETTWDYASEGSVQIYQTMVDLAPYCSPEAIEGVDVNELLDGSNNWAMMLIQFNVAKYIGIENLGLSDKYMIWNLPLSNAGEQTTWCGSTGMSIYKDSPKKDWAWEFIRFMHLDPVAAQWITDDGYIMNAQAVIDCLPSFMNEADLETMTYILNNIPEHYSSSWNTIYLSPIVNVSSTIQTECGNVFKGISTPEQAAANTQQAGIDYLKSK